MLESEARKKDCPFVTHSPLNKLGPSENIHVSGSKPPKCTGSDCMAWVKASPDEMMGYCSLLPHLLEDFQ